MVVALCAAMWGATPQGPQNGKAPASSAHGSRPAAAPGAKAPEDEGQVVFDQNCSRCHAAPEGFSQSISGTIVRHMRVRASLSQKQEQELLRYLNP